jgi:KR domain/Phosphopantetheine attachment site
VRHLLLAGRRGDQTPGAAELVDALAELEAEVTITACDVADRSAVAELLGQIPPKHPLTAVIHMAGIVDDATLFTLDGSRLDAVLRPKVDGVINLHELTQHLGLSAFVMFSSVSGVLGSAGQANYAAANAFLDGFAQYRRAQGLAATSLAWGLWAQATGISRHLSDSDRHRLAQNGSRPMSSAEGMELFDAGCRSHHAALVPLRLDYAGLSSRQAEATIHPLLSRLVNTVARRVAGRSPSDDGQSLLVQLQRMPAEKRAGFMVDLVHTEAAVVLGHTDSSSIEVQRQFTDLGFDSLLAVHLRNRLSTLVDRPLPATLVFDYPTPTALARHLLEDLLPNGERSRDADLIASTEHRQETS